MKASHNYSKPKARSHGFTIIELMVVVTIIGVLSAVAIPNFFSYQKRSKTSEVSSNLAALSMSENTYFHGSGLYVATPTEPAVVPGAVPVAFNPLRTGFDQLGWVPEGRVYFSYGVAITSDGTGFTADAAADIDADGFIQNWGYVHPNVNGVIAPGQVGCDATFPNPLVVASCNLASGKTIF
ncbi:MAG: prepilin-type N-terminal cleavage/methylation domain-containing protein [Myxococcota bacterium]|nr:prepilin-type N-terminal cleavage/methylation domain-containing protein [Myxococcota bacterium]